MLLDTIIYSNSVICISDHIYTHGSFSIVAWKKISYAHRLQPRYLPYALGGAFDGAPHGDAAVTKAANLSDELI